MKGDQGARRTLSTATASELLRFDARVSKAVGDAQLAGAVAVHNVLQREGVAYLADEVGMGKTYVALGAVALLRHFDPTLRVLVIAPRKNIQDKWLKELSNFTSNCVRFPDLRVKSVYGAPARAPVRCEGLLDLAREATLDPDRDFFVRLTSFSLALPDDKPAAWRSRRDALIELVPWLERELFDLRDKAAFKDNFARALCCALPEFDLVIVDEGHNLKAGFGGSASARNRLLGLALGRDGGAELRRLAGYGTRVRRALILSATPLESDFRQLWNQLDVLGKGEAFRGLAEPGTDEAKRELARRFLIRRVTTLEVGGERLTKNLYRREWRRGGVDQFDEELALADPAQRTRALLSVALVQKKVSELIGGRFNHSFQIGMLASFESFLQTSKVGKQDEGGNFDDAEQAEDVEERTGLDVTAVNRLASSYARKFKRPLPHPKMDAVVAALWRGMRRGEKALVFVRRVASVKELQRKLEHMYDEELRDHLRRELPKHASAVDELFATYQALQSQRRRTDEPAAPIDDEEPLVADAPLARAAEDDAGGVETFFAWFFRGEGPAGVLSGAALQRRLGQATGPYALFFEDNFVADVLGVSPGAVVPALASALALADKDVLAQVETRASRRLDPRSKRTPLEVFFAVQAAALELLDAGAATVKVAEKARDVLRERFRASSSQGGAQLDKKATPSALEQETFFTALRGSKVGQRLWPAEEALRRQELRRELIASMCRLGQPLISLYVLSVRSSDDLKLERARHKEESVDLPHGFVALLERQSESADTAMSAFSELAQAADNFDRILDVNAPHVRDQDLSLVAREFGRMLGRQQPVGGMSGRVQETLVRQFRMPGYPLALITTDLLQEGEDLHTFCSTIHHYGISWMPSSMEQRIGRIDRVGSQTERRLAALDRAPNGDELLQVLYPHLRQTVEVLQVRKVLRRMDRFIQLTHEGFAATEDGRRSIDTRHEMLDPADETRPIRHLLESSFPLDRHLGGDARPLEVGPELAIDLERRFGEVAVKTCPGLPIRWEARAPGKALLGTASIVEDARQQPFTLLLRSVAGRALIRCVSPVGKLRPEDDPLRIAGAARGRGVRVAIVAGDRRFGSYDVTIEGDVLLGAPDVDATRVHELIARVVRAADALERTLSTEDKPLDDVREAITREQDLER